MDDFSGQVKIRSQLGPCGGFVKGTVPGEVIVKTSVEVTTTTDGAPEKGEGGVLHRGRRRGYLCGSHLSMIPLLFLR